MNKMLSRYWFDTEKGLGIGVTAYNLEDAVSLVQSESITMSFIPDFSTAIENINIQDLDQKHVIPNIGVCSNRGVWVPNLNN